MRTQPAARKRKRGGITNFFVQIDQRRSLEDAINIDLALINRQQSAAAINENAGRYRQGIMPLVEPVVGDLEFVDRLGSRQTLIKGKL